MSLQYAVGSIDWVFARGVLCLLHPMGRERLGNPAPLSFRKVFCGVLRGAHQEVPRCNSFCMLSL